MPKKKKTKQKFDLELWFNELVLQPSDRAAIIVGTSYIDELLKRLAVSQLHNCGAVHHSTVPVTEAFQGRTIWQGEVEVFDLNGHPKAKRAYGWSHKEGKDDSGERFVAVLEIPPVTSPETAVKVAIAAEVKGKK